MTLSSTSNPTFRIRKGTPTDIPRLIELGQAMRLESRIHWPVIEPEIATANVKEILKKPDQFCVFVAEAEQVFGWIDGFITNLMFSTEKQAAHDIFYVDPEHRKKYPTAAMHLIRAYEGWARENGARRAVIREDTGINFERIGRLYERMGFEPMGGQYIKGL